MATYKSTLYNQQVSGLVPSGPTPAGEANNVKSFFATVALDTSAALNDLLDFGYVPAGAKIVDAALFSDDLDSNGTPLITLDVGDADGAATIFSASTIAQGAGADRSPVRACLGKQYTVKTLIQGKVHAAAATKAAGNVYLLLLIQMPGLPTS